MREIFCDFCNKEIDNPRGQFLITYGTKDFYFIKRYEKFCDDCGKLFACGIAKVIQDIKFHKNDDLKEKIREQDKLINSLSLNLDLLKTVTGEIRNA